MNVLLIGPSEDRVENHLLSTLPKAGVSLQVITAPGSMASQCCKERDIPFWEHEFPGRINPEGSALIRNLLKEFNPDIVHAVTNRALSNALLAVRKIKHPARIIAYRGTSGHLSWFDPAVWMSFLNPRVDRIVCVSDAVRRYLRGRGVPARKLTVIYKGHDPAWYETLPLPQRAEVGLPDEARVVGFVGNMRPVKGVEFLINALDHLPRALNVHLLLVGETRDDRLRPLADRDGRRDRIHFTGFRKDAAELAGLFELSVMPSIKREGLPKALIESMARRIPCIASDVGGMPELIQDGVSGLIVPPRNPKALAEAIQRLLENDDVRSKIGEAGRQRIEGPFHIRHTVKKTLALYEELTNSATV